jgi:hypothetical protein
MTVCGLRALRGAMEGIAASLLCTCGAEGQPNVSMIGQVHRVDDEHVALSWQVFNKTRANLMATGRACVELFDPLTHARHRLHPDHVETRTEGPLHEMMKARLAGIASPRGLEGVFRLLGADLFRVTGIGQLPPPRRRCANARGRRFCPRCGPAPTSWRAVATSTSWTMPCSSGWCGTLRSRMRSC